MDKPYKFELGEYYWWSGAKERVLLQNARCVYDEHDLVTVYYVLEKTDGSRIVAVEQELIGQLQKTNTEPPNQNRIDDLVEQVKAFLEQVNIKWDRPLCLCKNCGIDIDFEDISTDLTPLYDLQRALRAYLGEENP